MTALLLAARIRRNSTSFSEIARVDDHAALSLASFQRAHSSRRARSSSAAVAATHHELRLLSNATHDALLVRCGGSECRY